MPGDLLLRVDEQTFADDSFRIYDPDGIVVVGQVPRWSGVSWHKELARICGDDLKWSKVRHKWPHLSSDLRRAVTKDLRDSLIIVVDPSLYRFDLERTIASAVNEPESKWPYAFRQWAFEQIEEYELHNVLLDSPAIRVERYATLPDIYVDLDLNEDASVLDTFADRFEKPHNARLFAARSAAAFAPILDRDEWIKAVKDEGEDRRYITPEHIGRTILAKGERTQRVFDEGNQTSVAAINELKESVRGGLSKAGLITLPDPIPIGAVEQSSALTPTLQAGDLAAGYAEDLYRSSEGIRRVCEEFKGVILNGSMVRDWKQIERTDLDRLR